jgi:hypothetical protein
MIDLGGTGGRFGVRASRLFGGGGFGGGGFGGGGFDGGGRCLGGLDRHALQAQGSSPGHGRIARGCENFRKGAVKPSAVKGTGPFGPNN